MRPLLLAALLAAPAAAYGPLTPTPGAPENIQRYLASLRLGDTMAEIEQIYPPKKKWPAVREPDDPLTRIDIERGFSKWFPPLISQVRLGMRFGQLARIEVVYDTRGTRAKPVSELVADFSLMYGEPRRWGETYFWWDRATVLALANVPVKTARGVELRTSLALMERGHFPPLGE